MSTSPDPLEKSDSSLQVEAILELPTEKPDAAKLGLGEREVIAIMALLMSLNALAIDSMLPALPAIASDLQVAIANHRQYIISAYLLGLAGGSLLYGPIADRLGRKPVLKFALTAYLAMALGSAVAWDFELLIFFRFVNGFVGAALSIMVVTIIRDLYAGDAMARRMSMVFVLFMIVPMFAPVLGAVIQALAGWRMIFAMLALLGLVAMLWIRRLPETLTADNMRLINVSVLWAGCRQVTMHRHAAGYMLASGIMQGALFGYLTSSEQIIGEVFDAQVLFPLIFGCVALGIAAASFTNAHIVERFGARRVSHSAMFIFLVLGVCQLVISASTWENLPLFTLLIAGNVGLIGFIGANFGAVAMEDFGHMAGIASSWQTFVRSLIGAVLGAIIGQLYNGTTAPLAIGFIICAAVGIVLIIWAEKGRLFQHPHTTKLPTPPEAEQDIL